MLNSYDRYSAFRVMWILVFFDLPTETKKQRSDAGKFRKGLLKNGFNMFQFSIYTRHCPSKENAQVHIKRLKQMMPQHGHIGMISITDLQFGRMELFYNRKKESLPKSSQQLEFF